MTQATESTLHLHVRGSIVHVQCRNGSIVDFFVTTDQQDKTFLGRVCDYISHALYRIADVLHPRDYDGRGIRVIETMVSNATLNYLLADRTNVYTVKRIPRDLPNGDTDYKRFVVYEGVHHHQCCHSAGQVTELSGQQGTNDAHLSLLKDKAVHIWQDTTPL